MSGRPFFLCLDGIDGTGKSTQCRLLAEWLTTRGQKVTVCRDPGSTALGDEVRAILLNHRESPLVTWAEAFLFMASRAQLVEEKIRPALQSGECVICDRYVTANLVYQGHAGGLELSQLREVARLSTGGIFPDRTLILDLPIDVAEQRRGRTADRMEARTREYRERVRQGFRTEATLDALHFRMVDATGTIEEVQQKLREEIEALWVPQESSASKTG